MTRLIDADALWQLVFFHTYPIEILDNEKKILDEVLRIIDNAPTVSDRYSEGYATGYIDGSTGADWEADDD